MTLSIVKLCSTPLHSDLVYYASERFSYSSLTSAGNDVTNHDGEGKYVTIEKRGECVTAKKRE